MTQAVPTAPFEFEATTTIQEPQRKGNWRYIRVPDDWPDTCQVRLLLLPPNPQGGHP